MLEPVVICTRMVELMTNLSPEAEQLKCGLEAYNVRGNAFVSLTRAREIVELCAAGVIEISSLKGDIVFVRVRKAVQL